ncbi:MAG TPA: phage terminase large subunit [Pseudonocardiaceae bacterium]
MATTVVERSWTFRGAAQQQWERRDPELLLAGPAGTGKSIACLAKIHLMALANPGMRGLILRKTGVSLTSSGLVTFREQVANDAIANGTCEWYGGSQQEAAGYRYSNGSFLAVGGLDKPTKVMSTEYDVAYIQEATEVTKNDWEMVGTRLRYGRVSFQQLLADCNPDRPDHWLRKRCKDGSTAMLHSVHRDNPRIYDADGRLTEYGAAYMGRLDRLTGVRRLRLRDGLWVAADGVIFEDFREADWPNGHMINRFEVPDDWPRYWSVDFGFVHPFVCQRWAEDPDGRLIMYGEHYMTGRTVDQHAADILDAVSDPDPDYVHPEDEPRYAHHGRIWREPKPRRIICDHDAEGRAQLRKHLGMPTRAANKKVLAGIEAVQRRMRPAGDGKPRLAFMRDSLHELDQNQDAAELPTCTVQEIPGYVWDLSLGKKEHPVKELDDGCDTLRYLVADRDLRSRGNARFLD